jgi:energy-coupling factor transporter ATP-binding protein EcfA2
MLKLKRLKINKFRHVVPTELVFDDRYNVPLGINGSGKTTLLKLISACLRSDFSEYKSEELDVQYELAAENASLVITVRGQQSEVQTRPDELSIGTSSWPVIGREGEPSIDFSATVLISLAPELTFRAWTARGQSGLLIDGEEKPIVGAGARSLTEGPFLSALVARVVSFLAQREPKWASPQMPRGLLSGGKACYRFDESLELFQELTGIAGHDPVGPTTVLMKVYLSNDGTTISFQGTGPLTPRLFEWASDRQIDGVKASGALSFTSDDVPPLGVGLHGNFLKDFAHAARFARAEATLRALQEEKAATGRTFLLGAAAFRLRTKQGGSLSHELLSYGQKRLLSFLYYVACNDACVVADELVNGLHHAWIEVCLDAIGERQAFLTSQNPLLLDFLPPTSPEEAERRFIRCMLEEREGRDVMVWRNLTREEAAEFCEEYAVGVQQVSELLRVQGLW